MTDKPRGAPDPGGGGHAGGHRILVVEDMPEMREMIRRVLASGGYQVDVAPTLADARGRSPGCYHAVLVDARLGADNGLDLVREMLRADPAAAARVLVMTGGAIRSLPAGVALLAKPFRPDELLGAVRSLPAPRAGDHPAGSGTGPAEVPPGSGRPPPQPVMAPPTRPGAAPAPQASLRLLELCRRLRAHERRRLLDHLHEGPIQEIAAATLAVHVLRRDAPAALAERLMALGTRLDEAARGLRLVIDGQFLPNAANLATALPERTAWLHPARLTVQAPPAVVPPAGVPVVADLAELMLFALTEGNPPRHAAAVIGGTGGLATVDVTVTWGGGEPPPADPVAARQALAGMAAALGTTARAELAANRWRAVIAIPSAG